jgi:hypothetical protein
MGTLTAPVTVLQRKLGRVKASRRPVSTVADCQQQQCMLWLRQTTASHNGLSYSTDWGCINARPCEVGQNGWNFAATCMLMRLDCCRGLQTQPGFWRTFAAGMHL